MFIATHKKIAASAYAMFDDKVKALVDKTEFIEGSYYPDVNFKYTRLSHDYKSTIGIVREQIDEVLAEIHDEKALGRKLGIICHFIADYCSPYHVNKKYVEHSIIQHLHYELKTHKNTNFIFLQEKDMKNKSFKSVYTLEDDIKSFIAKHMQGEKDMKKEARLSLLNTFHIISMIMNEYIKIHISKNNYIDLFPSMDMPVVPYSPAVDAIAEAIYDEVEYLDTNSIP